MHQLQSAITKCLFGRSLRRATPITRWGYENLKNIFSIHGRASRKEFILQYILISGFWFGLDYYLRFVGILTPEKDSYLVIKLVLDCVALFSETPLMLRRIHDVHLPGYMLLIFWVLIPFSIRNINYLKHEFGFEINPNSWIMTMLNMLGMVLLVILFIYRSYSKENRWGSPGQVCRPATNSSSAEL